MWNVVMTNDSMLFSELIVSNAFPESQDLQVRPPVTLEGIELDEKEFI